MSNEQNLLDCIYKINNNVVLYISEYTMVRV